MTLMLVFLFASTAVGLVAPRLGRREHWLLAVMAAGVTLLYLGYSARFMT